MQIKKDIVWRLGVIYIFALSLALVIMGKVFYLQFVEGDKWKKKATELTQKDIIIPSIRGDILSHDGRLLASSVPFYEIRMDLLADGLTESKFEDNVDSLAWHLAELLKDREASEYSSLLREARKKRNRYLLIKRDANYSQMKRMAKFPIFRRGKYKGGFIKIQKNERMYPQRLLAKRTIGYMAEDKSGTTNGIVGIEQAYDYELRGVAGIRLMQLLSHDIWMPVNDGNEVEPQDGKDIVTTIDLAIQDATENALLEQLRKKNALHGTAIVMEVATGKIKAIANLKKSDNETDEFYEAYNYAIGESKEPGSTFKLASLLVALEDGYVNLNTKVNTNGGIVRYYGFPIRDSHKGGYGTITVQQAFELSSNVGVSKIISKHYYDRPKQFVDRLYSMNLKDKLNIKLSGEGTPLIKYPGDKHWTKVTLPQMSIGYEVHLTPLQTLTFYNAVANNGKMMKPMFINEIRQHGKSVKRFNPMVINSAICSQATIEKAKKMLVGVVERGTAQNLKNDKYKIAGKTGTAQIANRDSGYMHQNQKAYLASFAGFFPADKPKYSCIVAITTLSPFSYYGNEVAVPVFKNIADKIFATSLDMYDPINPEKTLVQKEIPYSKSGNRFELEKVFQFLKIPVKNEDVNNNWVATKRHNDFVSFDDRNVKQGEVPKVLDMGLKDALFILENVGLKVKIKGRGKVIRQSMKPGKKIRPGDVIEIELS